MTWVRSPLAAFQVMVFSVSEKLTILATSACMMCRTNSTVVCSVEEALSGWDAVLFASAGGAIRAIR